MRKVLKNLILVCSLALLSNVALAQGKTPSAAKLHYDSGLMDKAKTAIDLAMENEKFNVKAKTWYIRGLIYAGIASDQTGLYGELADNPAQTALDSYKKALDILANASKPEKGVKEETEAAMANLYPIVINYGAQQFNAGGDEGARGALDAFLLAQKLKPEDPLAYAYAADIGYNLQDMEAVISSIKKLITLDIPADDTTSGIKSMTRYYAIYAFYLTSEEDDKETALQIAKQGVEKNKPESDPDTYLKLQRLMVSLYIELEQWDEAIENLTTVAEKSPSPESYFNLGRLYENKEEEDKAIEYYKKSIAVEDNYNALYNLAAIYFNKGAEIKKEVDQMDIDEYNKRGKEIEAQANEQFEKALPYFERVKELDLDVNQEENVLGPLVQLYKVFKREDDAKKAEARLKQIIGE